MKKAAFVFLLAGPLAMALVWLGLSADTSPALANGITVSGDCSLVEAIENANDSNDGQPNPDCAAGDPAGPDTITLTENVILTAAYPGSTELGGGVAGTPDISSSITIEGPGLNIQRDSGLGESDPFRVFNVMSGGSLTLVGVSVTDGRISPGEMTDAHGGGIYVAGSLLLDGVAIGGHTVRGGPSTVGGGGGGSGRGGGIFLASGTATIHDSIISSNTAAGGTQIGAGTPGIAQGGGIAVMSGATLSLTNSDISSNVALGDAGDALGGGIFNEGTIIDLSNSRLHSNDAGDEQAPTALGGGITNLGSIALWSNTVLESNSARAASDGAGLGGGLYNQGLLSTLESSTFADNVASGQVALGGGIYNNDTILVATNSTLSGNETNSASSGGPARGGGLYNATSAQANLSAFTIAGNTTDLAGAGTEEGAGFYGETGTALSLVNSIVADNLSDNGLGGPSDCAGDYTDGGYNLQTTGGGCAAGFLTVDSTGAGGLNLGPLADNGATQPVAGPGDVLTHAIDETSAAMDAGSCTAAGVGFDQRGLNFTRPYDGVPANADDGCDIGAFEYQTGAAYASDPAAPGPLLMAGVEQATPATTFDISNVGDPGSMLNASVKSITGGYSVTGGLPISLLTPAGAPVTVTVQCDEPGTTPEFGTLVVGSNDPAALEVSYNLECTEIAPRYVSTPAVFGTLEMVGQANTPALGLLGIGNAGTPDTLLDVELAGISDGFSVNGLPIEDLPELEWRTVQVYCDNPADEPTGELDLISNDDIDPTPFYHLDCREIVPQFNGDPSPPGPLVMQGPAASSPQASFTVSNTGEPGTTLDVGLVSISTGYSVVSGLPISLLGQGAPARTVTVQCDDPALSPATGTLLLAANDVSGGGPQTYRYDLTCTEITQVVNPPTVLDVQTGCAALTVRYIARAGQDAQFGYSLTAYRAVPGAADVPLRTVNVPALADGEVYEETVELWQALPAGTRLYLVFAASPAEVVTPAQSCIP